MSLRFLESKSGAVVRALASHPCGPGFESWLRRHYVGWACCWFSPLFRGVFLRELQFFPLLKNQHFQIPIRSGAHGHVSTSCHELLSAPWVPNYNLQLQLQFSGSKAEYFFEPLPTSYIVFPCEFGYDATASRSFSGNWLAPALLHSSRLPLFLFQAQLASRGWGCVWSTIGKEYEKGAVSFSQRLWWIFADWTT